MSRAGTKGGGKSERPDDHAKEVSCPAAPHCATVNLALIFEPHSTPPTSTTPQVVPLSLQKLRDLADSLRATMPVNDERHSTRQWRGAL